MSFRPGCHRPFHRSACLCSLLLLSWVSLLFIVWFLSFLLLLYPDLVLQHVLTSTVVTLRPFALSLYSWRVLFFVGGAGFEPAMSYAFFAAYLRHYPFSGLFQCCLRHSAILPSRFVPCATPQGLATSVASCRRISHFGCSSQSHAAGTPTASLSSRRSNA